MAPHLEDWRPTVALAGHIVVATVAGLGLVGGTVRSSQDARPKYQKPKAVSTRTVSRASVEPRMRKVPVDLARISDRELALQGLGGRVIGRCPLYPKADIGDAPRDVRRISLDIGTPRSGRAPEERRSGRIAVASVIRASAGVPNDLMILAIYCALFIVSWTFCWWSFSSAAFNGTSLTVSLSILPVKRNGGW
jgi:hypothetical protein